MDGGEGDQFYVLLEGNDILADAFIGRLSFDSITQLQTIVNKILKYEREPYLGQTAWYEEALMVGDPSHSGPACVDTKRQIANMITYNRPNFDCEEIYSGSWVTHIRNSINSGVSYFNYRGYIGMSGWDSTDINSLNNGFMLPVVVTLTCDVGSFASGWSEARTETFLRVGSPTLPKGAVAAIGTATSSTHTCFNNCVDMGIFGGIFNEGIYHLGGALNSGKLNLYLSYPQNPANAVYQFSYWNNLMGDPGMEIWTGVPQELLVSYDSQVALGSNYLEVMVTDDLGSPLSDAWVTISRDNEGLFATGLTDTAGRITLPIATDEEGSAHLVVTRHDSEPHLGSFTIGQQPQHVSITDHEIDDDNSGESSGNGDGIVNPGEQVELSLSLSNHGTDATAGVTAVLSSDSEYLTITDDYENYGAIPAGGTVNSDDDFGVTIADNTLGGMELRLDLLISDLDLNEWSDVQYITVAGPNLHQEEWEIISDDGILDPGETALLQVTLRNGGTVDASSISAELISHHPRVTVEDADGFFGNIPAGGEETNSGDTFELTASSIILPGTQVTLELLLTNPAGYEQSVTFLMEVGLVTVTDPLGPDSYGYCVYDDGDTEYYNAPVYEWIEIADGLGQELPLYDSGNMGDVEQVELDFLFRFYGVEYDELTVCSNGWISPGYTQNESFMNWYIPGPSGPSPIIAPFWDDLRIGSGGVYYYNDPVQHYCVVEWSHLSNDWSNSEETFQVVLYDPLYYPTSTGDSQILFQYETVNNNDVGQYGGGYVYHGQYATVGIEDHSSMVGLEYTFNNSYPTAAKPLQDEMALLFTGYPILHDDPFLVLGELTISDSGGDGMIDFGELINLSINLNNIGQDAATSVSAVLSSTDDLITMINSNSGYDDIPSEAAGTNVTPFSFEVDGGIPDGHMIPMLLTASSSEDSWELNFTLQANAPEIVYSSLYADDGDNGVFDPGETADALIAFHNNGGAAAYNATVVIASEDEYLTLNSTSFNFEALQGGETHIATYNISVAEGAPIGHIAMVNWSLTADTDYNAVGIIAVPIAQVGVWLEEDFSNWLPTGWTATSSSGQINWGDSNSSNAGGSAPEAQFSYSPSTVATQRLISPAINTLGHNGLELEFKHYINHFAGVYELRLETTTDGENWTVVTSWPAVSMEGTTEQIVISNDDVGSESFQFAWVFDGDSYNINYWNIDDVMLGTSGFGIIRGTVTLDGGAGDIEDVLVEAAYYTTRPDPEGNYMLLLPEDSYTLFASLEGYENFTEEGIVIEANGTTFVDILLEPLQGVLENMIPQVTELIGNYPNPFNPSTTFEYSLAAPAGRVEIAIYNITGQRVSSLIEHSQAVGYYDVSWDATSNTGRPIASGLYFYQLRVDSELISTQRMLLLR